MLAGMRTNLGSLGQRDAALRVQVLGDEGGALQDALVRVFLVQDEQAALAAETRSNAAGVTDFASLPRGDAWVLVYAAGRARVSTPVRLVEGRREARVVLPEAHALDVTVIDGAERPIVGAAIEVVSADPLVSPGRSDEQGLSRHDRLGGGPFVVRVRAPGYDEVVHQAVAPGALRVKLERMGALLVSVVDEDGHGMPEATVLVAGPSLWPARSATTDANGTVRIGGLKAGVYDLKARTGSRVSATEIGVSLRQAEDKAIRLALEPGRMAKISVVDGVEAGAAPVPSASVVLAEQGLSSFPLEGTTDAQGVVVLGPVAKGSASVSARAPGFVPRGAVLLAPDKSELRVPLARGGTVVGEVVDDRGDPVEGAFIEIVGVDDEGMPIDETASVDAFQGQHFASVLGGPRPLLPVGELGVMAGPVPDLPHAGVQATPAPPHVEHDPWRSAAEGRFHCAPVAPGRIRVIARHAEYVEGLGDAVSLRAGGEVRARVVLRRGGLLTGRVLEEDRTPVSGARVEIAAIQGALARTLFASKDGSFELASVPEEVLVSVARPGALADVVARVVVSVPNGERRRIEVLLPKPRDAMTIRVVDDRGYPVSRVEVKAVALDPKVSLWRTIFTNDDGEAALPDAVGLALRLTLLRPTKAPRIELVDPAPPTFSLVLREGIEATGMVTSRDGRDRVSGAEITLYTLSGARRSRTDSEGRFVVKDLAMGRVRMVVTHPRHARAEVVREVADATRVALDPIDLDEAGEVSGEVVDEAGAPLVGARVASGTVPSYLPIGPLPTDVAVTDKNGHFVLRGVAAGEAHIEAYLADRGRAAADHVDVVPGRSTDDVRITFAGEPTTVVEPKGAGSIAVTLAERTEDGKKHLVVILVAANSEAELAGVEPGDRLTAVNGRVVRSLESARESLSGPLAEDVALELSRDQGSGWRPWMVRVRRERVRR